MPFLNTHCTKHTQCSQRHDNGATSTDRGERATANSRERLAEPSYDLNLEVGYVAVLPLCSALDASRFRLHGCTEFGWYGWYCRGLDGRQRNRWRHNSLRRIDFHEWGRCNERRRLWHQVMCSRSILLQRQLQYVRSNGCGVHSNRL